MEGSSIGNSSDSTGDTIRLDGKEIRVAYPVAASVTYMVRRHLMDATTALDPENKDKKKFFNATGVAFDGEFLWVVDRFDRRDSYYADQSYPNPPDRCRIVKFRVRFPQPGEQYLPWDPTLAWEVGHFYPRLLRWDLGPLCPPVREMYVNDLNEFPRFEFSLCGAGRMLDPDAPPAQFEHEQPTAFEWGVR